MLRLQGKTIPQHENANLDTKTPNENQNNHHGEGKCTWIRDESMLLFKNRYISKESKLVIAIPGLSPWIKFSIPDPGLRNL